MIFINNHIIITCEHASNKIPVEWQYLFASNIAQKDLNDHHGIDLGAKHAALYFAKFFSKYFSCDLEVAKYSRLLIELNRSINHNNLFSKYTNCLDNNKKSIIIDKIYKLYRTKIEQIIERNINLKQKIIHLSIHSFTPILNNQVRNTDIGILYDPKRGLEKKLCKLIKTNYIIDKNNKYKLRLNYPYKGYTDGFTTYLRKIFDEDNYIGLEIEINQKYCDNNVFPKGLLDILCFIINKAISQLDLNVE